ncbi:MAG: hypothetical protein R6V06_04420 [Kiritimatiellia bacterium]
MKKAVAKIELTTPCISSGADQKVGELRSASMRGLLHFWFRVTGGSLVDEQAIFGRIGKQEYIRKGSLTTRLRVPPDLKCKCKDGKSLCGNNFDYFLWPLRDQKHTPGSGQRGIIEQGQSFELLLSHQRIQSGRLLSENVLKTALLLGSLGTRSRRCYGSLWPTEIEIDGGLWAAPKSLDELSQELNLLLTGKNISVACWGSETDWRSSVKLASDTFKHYRCGSETSGGTPTKWGRNDHDTPLQRGDRLYRPAFGLPLAQRYSGKKRMTTRTFVDDGSRKGNDRWASPLLLKVVPLEGKYFVLAIFLNDYLLKEGTRLQVKEKGRVVADAELNLDLWREVKSFGDMLYSP